MSVREIIKPAIPSWVKSGFEELEKAANGQKSGPLHGIRQEARKVFERKGFPGPQLEDWKYTSLSDLGSHKFELLKEASENVQSKDFERFVIGGPDAVTLVFCNGSFSSALSSAGIDQEVCPGLRTSHISTIFSDEKATAAGSGAEFQSENALIALNTSFIQEGLRLQVARGANIDRTVNLLFITSAEREAFIVPRIRIEMAESARMRVVETHIGLTSGTYFSVPVTEIFVAKNAKLDYHKVGMESKAAFHTGHVALRQERDSHASLGFYTFGGKLVRNEARVTLAGVNGHCAINALTVIADEQHVDNHTVIDHATPHCESRETVKGVYDDKSRGVFNGTIIVRQDAQKTNAFQSNQTILLSKDANIDTKPQLKIWADDVKCTHGATVGQLDENALFYLRARGISKENARNMLIRAFASELLREIDDENLVSLIDDLIEGNLKTKAA